MKNSKSPHIIRVKPRDLKEKFDLHDVLYLYDKFIADAETGVARLFVASGKTVKFVKYDAEEGFVWVMDSVDQIPYKVRRLQLIKPINSDNPRVA